VSIEKTKSELCRSCGKCCQIMIFPIVLPVNKSLFEDWLKIRGGRIVKSDNTLYAEIYAPCPYLNKSESGIFSCSIYDNRPDGCKQFDGTKYDFLDCAWKDKFVVLEKAIKCEICGKAVTQMGSRFKRGNLWVRRFRCSKGHVFEEVQ